MTCATARSLIPEQIASESPSIISPAWRTIMVAPKIRSVPSLTWIFRPRVSNIETDMGDFRIGV